MYFVVAKLFIQAAIHRHLLFSAAVQNISRIKSRLQSIVDAQCILILRNKIKCKSSTGRFLIMTTMALYQSHVTQ